MRLRDPIFSGPGPPSLGAANSAEFRRNFFAASEKDLAKFSQFPDFFRLVRKRLSEIFRILGSFYRNFLAQGIRKGQPIQSRGRASAGPVAPKFWPVCRIAPVTLETFATDFVVSTPSSCRSLAAPFCVGHTIEVRFATGLLSQFPGRHCFGPCPRGPTQSVTGPEATHTHKQIPEGHHHGRKLALTQVLELNGSDQELPPFRDFDALPPCSDSH